MNKCIEKNLEINVFIKLMAVNLTECCGMFQTIVAICIIRSKKRTVLNIIGLVSFFVIYGKIIQKYSSPEDFGQLFDLIEKSDIKDSYCELPSLKIEGHSKYVKQIKCKSEFDWGYTLRGHWYLANITKQLYKNIKCTYRKIKRIDDFNLKESIYYDLFENDFIDSEVFEVKCIGITNKREYYYENLHAQILPIKRESSQLKGSCRPLNILMICYDSVSRVSFLRRMKKSAEFMLDKMGFEIFEGFNILGDGTPAALIPILTGFTEEELPSTLKNDPYGKYVDEVYPFIFDDLTNLSYINYFNEDWPHVGTFYYRMRGMKSNFVDHYLRPYQLKLWNRSKFNYALRGDLCIGAKTRHKKSIELLHEFIDVYKNKTNYFGFMHYSENSHDGNSRLNIGDQDLYEFLNENYYKGNFNETIVFVFGDHGDRFNEDRQGPQGYLEERLPFMSIYIPEKYRSEQKWENFLLNRKKLISAFDIHKTLRDVTCLEHYNISKKKQNENNIRSLSLLNEIPLNRSCHEIGISSHFCVCSSEIIHLNPKSEIGLMAAQFLVDFINSLIKKFKDCIILQLGQIVQTQLIRTNNNLQVVVKFITMPNDALYEATVQITSVKPPAFQIQSKSTISRLNAYGQQAYCIDNFKSLIDVRKFCYCNKTT